MENEKENIVPNDRRAITIHSYSLWKHREFDTKISIYYLPKNSYKEEGYIIKAKIQIVRDSKIGYITKKYFDKIYKKFENINLKALKKESYQGCDGWQLEVKMGMLKCTNEVLYEPLKFTEKIKNISLWSPMEDKKRPEMSKLLKLIKSIEAKIEFDKWYDYNYKEWEKYSDTFYDLRDIFRINFDIDDDW